MTGKQNQEVVHLRFDGEQYDAGGLDDRAMRVIIEFQKVLKELAKYLYKSKNYDGQYDESNLDVRTRLVLKTIGIGSTKITLEIADNPTDPTLKTAKPPELVEAVNLVYESYIAARSGSSLPSELPTEFIPKIASINKPLAPSARLAFAPRSRDFIVIDGRSCRTLMKWVQAKYADSVSVTGVVVQANIRTRSCRLFDPFDKRSVNLYYKEEDEKKVTRALHDHGTARLIVEGEGEFNEQGRLLKFTSYKGMRMLKNDTGSYASGASIEEKINRIISKTPKRAFDELPSDMAETHDHID